MPKCQSNFVSLEGLLATRWPLSTTLQGVAARCRVNAISSGPRLCLSSSCSASRPCAGCSHCNELRSFHPLRIAWSRSRSRSRSHRSCIPLLVSWLLIYGPCPSGLATDPVRNWSGRPHLNISWAGQWSSICCCEIAASSSSWAHSHILWHYTLDQALPLAPRPSQCTTFGPELIFHAKRSSWQTTAAPREDMRITIWSSILFLQSIQICFMTA